MTRWDSIEAFVAVADTGGFSAAARSMGASPSYVSRAVRRLESRLGVQLLYRTTRQTSLTDAGRGYYEHCRQFINGLDTADRAIQTLEPTPRGHFRLTCATRFGERYIAPTVNDFLLRHPEVSLEFHLTNRLVDIVQDGYDLAIRLGTLRDSGLVARRLAPRRLYVCAAPAYLERHGAPETPADLGRHNCLAGSTDHWTFQMNSRHEEHRIRGTWRCNSGPALLDATVKGLGLAQLPDYYVLQPVQRGELVSVLEAYQHTGSGVWAVYPRSRYPAPTVRALVDFLVERFTANPPGAAPAPHRQG